MTQTSIVIKLLPHVVMTPLVVNTTACGLPDHSSESGPLFPVQPVYEHFRTGELVYFPRDAHLDRWQLDSLVIGRVIDVVDVEPTKTDYTRKCVPFNNSEIDNTTLWRHVRFQIEGVVDDERGDVIADDVIDLMMMHIDTASPMQDFSNLHERIALRIPREADWASYAPTAPASINDAGSETERLCPLLAVDDVLANPDGETRVLHFYDQARWRRTDVGGETYGFNFVVHPRVHASAASRPNEFIGVARPTLFYSFNATEVCAMNHMPLDGAAQPVRSYDREIKRSDEDYSIDPWCWPREQVECFVTWRPPFTGATSTFDCDTLAPMPEPVPVDGGPGDAGFNDAGVNDAG